LVGVSVGKAFNHRNKTFRGYFAILAVHKDYRNRGIGTKLSQLLLDEMILVGVDEIVLETEDSNFSSLNLYEKLGFARDKHLPNYYLNGSGAYRLKLWLK
jgi:N-alpha-acetyltransferase 30